MKRTSLIWIACMILFIHPRVSGQQADSVKHKHAIGIGAGFTTAYGLSYRYTPSRLGVQVNFAPFKNDYVTSVSSGVTFLYTLIPGNVASLFLYQGNHYYYKRETIYFEDATKNISTPGKSNFYDTSTDSYINNGVGFGIELLFAKQVGFNLMAGYASYVNFTQINITGEVGLYFKF
jgi:hypothetical protein